ncbi:hypothetical protein BpHYR1_001364 [Brachionus plicatilis]|uniref:Uncharacterized protein n=1 Tax=Brachionus plicatilis TaxID=10195 RepID=A0A3M7SKH0_BRAPC|nr:hypothetical protein BpHYR1_001364 [Brachionus plicatilis]
MMKKKQEEVLAQVETDDEAQFSYDEGELIILEIKTEKIDVEPPARVFNITDNCIRDGTINFKHCMIDLMKKLNFRYLRNLSMFPVLQRYF